MSSIYGFFFFSVKKKSKALGINAIDIGLCSVVQHQAQSAHLSQVLREDLHFFSQTKCFKLLIKTNRSKKRRNGLFWIVLVHLCVFYRSACLACVSVGQMAFACVEEPVLPFSLEEVIQF